jgi:biopolymer transport protein ExbB
MYPKKALLFGGLIAVALLSAAPAEAAGVGTYWADVRRWFGDGGNTMWFILASSVLAVAFTVERLIRMKRARIVPRKLAAQARELWKQGKHDEIIALCEDDDSTLARAIKRMVVHRDVPMADVRTIVGDSMSSEFNLFHRRTHPIAVAATVAPLLGLFGTVSGMITAFRQFRALGETGDPGVFAGAISIALITTEAGLMVAIPSLLMWHWFRNRTNAYVDEMEGIIQELLLEWFLVKNAAPTK